MTSATDEFVGFRVHAPDADAEDKVFRLRTDTWAKRPLDHLSPFLDEVNPHPRRESKRTRNQMRAYSAAFLQRWAADIKVLTFDDYREAPIGSYAKWYASLPAEEQRAEQFRHAGSTGERHENYILGKVEVA